MRKCPVEGISITEACSNFIPFQQVSRATKHGHETGFVKTGRIRAIDHFQAPYLFIMQTGDPSYKTTGDTRSTFIPRNIKRHSKRLKRT